MFKKFSLRLLSISVFLAVPAVALARVDPGQPVSDTQLEQMRGGFLTAGGFAFDFGAVTRTIVDGKLVLETQLTWTPAGVATQSSGVPTDSAMMARLAAAGIHPGDLAGANVYVTPDGGSTVIQGTAAGQLTNTVLNTASGRTITQNTEIALTLPGFAAQQAQISRAVAAAGLADIVAQAGLAAARR